MTLTFLPVRFRGRLIALFGVFALTISACGTSTTNPGATASVPSDSVPSDSVTAVELPPTNAQAAPTSRADGPVTIRVPADQATIQLAVDAAAPGDLILIAPGTYPESVIVRTPNVVIRGEDRNTVVLDGSDELQNGFQVSADGVAIENLTVKRYQINGIVFTNAYDAPDPNEAAVLQGYRASYVTVLNNGLYGLYAFYASGGQFDHVYGSGHPDGGIYIGQCKPCNALVTDAVMERNGLGYSGTNASGGVNLINSVYRRNRIGMSPNSQLMERLSPQTDVVIAGNLVEDNDDPQTPPAASGAFGFGIVVGGGERNVIVRNRVRGNSNVGIAITTLDDFVPSENRVEGNVSEDNGVDLAFYSAKGIGLPSAGNCFVGNTFDTSAPEAIEAKLACGASSVSITEAADRFVGSGPPTFDYRAIPTPGPQLSMPDAMTAPAIPASAKVPVVDLATIKVPS
jgi:parallel beta-helix repeat protein